VARHQVELLWSRDCVNHQAALEMLEAVLADIAPDTPILSVDASDPEVAGAHRFPGSPTIRVDGRDVDPSFQEPVDYTPRCRIYWTASGPQGIPERAWLEALLRS
jgi:hypothetical protein